MTRRWLQSADVEVDEATGALLVQVGDAEIKIASATSAVAGPQLAVVDDTAGGQSLETMLGAALSANLKRLTLYPTDETTIHWAAGAADANSPPLPAGGIDLPVDKTYADTLRFFAATAAGLTVIQFG